MTTIAHGMGVHTLAEGVETMKQADFLKEAGVEMSQGFLYRKPESLSTILFKIANGSIRPACESSDELNRFFSHQPPDAPEA
jgi:EAL domain-containing protein (putative c-di-GMP-specific phosphodiesterase class I)